jgi:rhodanese-related sulfurtransferase
MGQRQHNIFSQLQFFENEIIRLENRILELEQRHKQLFDVQRNHLIRVKNGEELSDDFILSGRRYHDLSPDKAWKLYQDPDFDFTIIDVSSRESSQAERLPEALHIPWEDFKERFIEITSRSSPLLIISEDGTKSILACDFLVRQGFYNCNNISGGYKFWQGYRLEAVKSQSA